MNASAAEICSSHASKTQSAKASGVGGFVIFMPMHDSIQKLVGY